MEAPVGGEIAKEIDMSAIKREKVGNMDGLEAQVWETVKQYKLLRRGDRVVAAVSGGADSVCLLALLARWREPMGISLRVLHVHHGLRGAEADRDADFVERFAGQWGSPCTIRRFDVRKTAQ